MTDPNDEPKKPSVNADNNSNAVGSISAGGNIGDIHIGNIYQTPEDDIPVSSDEIENGLTRFAQFIPERAPILQDSFSSIARKLRATLGADQNLLSHTLKKQREETLDAIKPMCMEVTDISFRAMCLGQNPPPYDSRPPFLGLFAFRPEDREFFFGRDALVQKLVARIKAHPFLAVLGASGSGKSSLVMAGLVPALEAQMSYLTPSSAPLSQLLTAMESASTKTVFVIDQFEEFFTHPHDAAERADFIHALLELTKTNRVVITMRADFWGEVAIYTDLKQAMQEHQELIAPMTVDELHSAMEKQAAVVGLRFDPTLSESILDEVKGEPGAMPLLQHALWELWNRRHGLWIKAEEYQAFGGVKQAIASTAEEVYASGSDFERNRVRDIFLRLTRLDESGEGRDTRRRVLIEELIPANSDSSVTIKLLNKLADARLIVKTDKDVEVAHEALIRHWSRLISWLNEDRDNLRLREGVSESAREWEDTKRDDSLLNHRGGRLELALVMSKLPRYQLNPIEQAYLNACVSLRNNEQREHERRLRWTVTASVAAAVIFLALGSFGLVKSNEATNQARVAIARQLIAQGQLAKSTRSSNELIAVLLALRSMQLSPSFEAEQMIQNNTFGHPIAQMNLGETITTAVFSLDGKYMVGSEYKTIYVWDIASSKEISHMSHDDSVLSVAFSPDSNYVLSTSRDKTVRVWEVSTGKEIARVTQEYFLSVAFNPDGKYVASAGCDEVIGVDCKSGSASVWEATSGKVVARILTDNYVISVAFSPDGQYVVFGSADKTVRIWDLMAGKEIARLKHDAPVYFVRFSPNGKYMVSASDDQIIRVWEVSKWEESARLKADFIISNPEASKNLAAFSMDSHYMALVNIDKSVLVFDVLTGRETNRIQQDEIVTTIAYSQDGRYIVSGSLDNTARVWSVNSGKEVARMTHDSRVISASFDKDDKYVISVSSDGTVRTWEPTTQAEIALRTQDEWVSFPNTSPDNKYYVLLGPGETASVHETISSKEVSHMTYAGSIESAAFSSDNKYVVLGSADKTARVWEVTTGKEISRMIHDGSVRIVAFSPDGKYVVSGSEDKTARVWDAASGKEIARMRLADTVNCLAFSQDDKYIVTGSYDKTVRVWDAASGKEIARMTHGDVINSVAFSPDGKYIVSGSQDKTARVWEIASGNEVARMTFGDFVSFVSFSKDGKFVASLEGSSLRVWLWQPQDILTDTCTYLPRNLTRAEWNQYIGDALPYQAVCPNLPIEPESTPAP